MAGETRSERCRHCANGATQSLQSGRPVAGRWSEHVWRRRCRPDQRDAEIGGEQAQGVEQNSLLPVRAGEQRMNLIDDEYPGAYKLHQVACDAA